MSADRAPPPKATSGGTEGEPVRRLDRRTVAENSKWRVTFDHVESPEGLSVPDYLVIEPLKPRADLVTGVSVLPIVDGRAVLVRCYRFPLERDVWEVVRGFVEPGEDLMAAVLRELSEETGLTCRPADVVPLGCCMPEPSTMVARGALFAALHCRPGGHRIDDELGLGEMRSFDLSELDGMMSRFEIEEASTALTILRFRLWQAAYR